MAIYDFRDTIITAQSGSDLPSEAMLFNGKTIENEIEGYKTLNVSGRELTSTEIEEYTVGRTNGSKLKYTRKPSRSIVVRYQLKANTAHDFRTKFNSLNSLLQGENVLVIFADEPDKYFNGTVGDVEKVEPGLNNVVSEFTIFCTDPFKYSLVPKTTTAVNKLINTVCEGTHQSKPVLTAIMNSDNGFLAFANQEGALLQFGKTEEVDQEVYAKSETLINDRLDGNQIGWVSNVAVLNTWANGLEQTGYVGHTTFENTQVVNPESYGSGPGWHGPSLTKTIPADSNGIIGSKNFELEFHHFYEAASLNDVGMCQIAITDKTGKNITSLSFYKRGQGTNNAAMQWLINGVVIKEDSFSPTYNNTFTSRSTGRTIIRKMEGVFTLTIGGRTYTYTDNSITSWEASKISWYAAKFNTLPPIAVNYLIQMTFKKHNVEKWRDIPNQFAKHDVVKIDTKENRIYKNGLLAHELDALGNDWERFLIHPGVNQITCMCSSWATVPDIQLEYEETYL